MTDPMPQEAKEALAIDKAAAMGRAAGPYACLTCGAGIRRPRLLRTGGIVYKCRTRQGDHVDEAEPDVIVTMTWCSQACLDAWLAQYVGHLPGPHWPVYRDGVLEAYVIPGRGRVPVEAIEAAREA